MITPRKATLSIVGIDGFPIDQEGRLLLEACGLSDQLRLIRGIYSLIRLGIDLFPGQQSLEPILSRLFQESLQVVIVGRFQRSPAEGAPPEEFIPVAITKGTKSVLTAESAIRALMGNLQIIKPGIVPDVGHRES